MTTTRDPATGNPAIGKDVEANAMIGDRTAHVDLEDEYGTGQLGFVLRRGSRSVRICMGQTGREAWVELQRPSVVDEQPIEPEDQDVLEDLVVELLADPVGEVRQ